MPIVKMANRNARVLKEGKGMGSSDSWTFGILIFGGFFGYYYFYDLLYDLLLDL